MPLGLLSIFKNKYFIYGVIIVALLIGGYFIVSSTYKNVYNKGYQAGVAYQQQQTAIQQAKAQQQFDMLQKKADEDRLSLNNKILELQKDKLDREKQLAQKQNTVNQEKIDYAKGNAGNMSCFAPDDNGLRIINKSFPSYSN